MVSTGLREPKYHFLSFRMSGVMKSVKQVWEYVDSSGRGIMETQKHEGFQKW